MTDIPQNGNGAASIAALAVRIDGLHREVKAVTGQLKALVSTQQEHSAALGIMEELRHQVELIVATLDDEDDASPNTWFWLTMSKQQHNEKFAELYDWVETVLRPQYPDYVRDHIKPCWPNHPEAKWELTWLYQLWTLAYLAKRPALKDAADWHDRWAPGTIRRLSEAMRVCERACHRQPDQSLAHDHTSTSVIP